MSGMTAPLAGIRVLDVGHYLAGPLVGMLLADQGADVVKVDPPGGPRFRHVVNAMLNRGKAVVELDLKTEAGQASFLDLVQAADILIENFSKGTLDRLGMSLEHLRKKNPELIVVSLPGFGPDDPVQDGLRAWEGVIAAATGQFTDIHVARQTFGLDPVYTALPLASVYAAVHAATAAVLAVGAQERSGRGIHVVAPLANAAVSAMTSIYMKVEGQPERYSAPRLPGAIKRWVLPIVRELARKLPSIQPKLLAAARKAYPALMRSYGASDGEQVYIFALDNPKITDAAIRAFELDGVVADLGLVRQPSFAAGDRSDNLWEASNLARDKQAHLAAAIAQQVARHSAREVQALLDAHGVPGAIHRSTEAWLKLHELREAGLVIRIDDPEIGPTLQPGLQTWTCGLAARPAIPAPARRYEGHWQIRARARPPEPRHELKRSSPGDWLAGTIVLDLTSMVAGPVAARTLAEYGARVIRIEATRPNHGPRMTCWYGLDVNQGKQSALVDLKTAAGREMLRRWVSRADILLTNHLPEALDRLGLAEPELRALRPELIIARISAYEGPLVGPWANRHGYDPVLQAASGIMTRYGSPRQPELHAIASCVDALTGYSAAFGIALALKQRKEAGSGCSVATSLAAAANLIQLPFAVLNNGPRAIEPSGQVSRGENACYRMYRARDGWLFLAAPRSSPGEVALALAIKDDSSSPEATLERAISLMKLSTALSLLSAAGISATSVRSVAEVRSQFDADQGSGPTFVRRPVRGLDFVVQAVPRQVYVDGRGLRIIEPAAKPGAHGEELAREVGLDPESWIASGGGARELSRDYLPD